MRHKENREKYPNFLFAGAPKCGTSSIYRNMYGHPEVFCPEKKEPLFFCVYELPEDVVRRSIYPIRYGSTISRLDEYAQIYSDVQEEKAVGDFSTTYLLFPNEVITNMRKIYGERSRQVKVLFCIRNPIDATRSSYQMYVRDGHVKKTFEEELDEYTRRYREGYILNSGIHRYLYFERLKTYMDYFDNVRIMLFDDLRDRPKEFMRSVFSFLEVDPEHDNGQYNKIENKGLLFRAKWIKRTLRNPGCRMLRVLAKDLMPRKAHDGLKKTAMTLMTKQQELEWSNEVLIRLRSFFRSDIQQTSRLIDCDLEKWLD